MINNLKNNEVFKQFLYSALLFKDGVIPFNLPDDEFISEFNISKEDFKKELQKVADEFDFDLNID